MASSLLVVGDLHLGRRPDDLGRFGLDPGALGPVAAWEQAVVEAERSAASAVLLAGDVVDDVADRFEAYGHLERGVARLAAAGIPVVGVAGNHDGVALPRLAARIPAFRLLGAGGRWERIALGDVDLLGWSFPAPHHRPSPLESPGLDEALAGRRPDAPCLGLLHADLDAGASPYAPVASSALAALPVDRWLLGHRHRPDALGDGLAIGYLGSLVGLDRSETGPHGAWRVTVHGPGRIDAVRIPLGPLRWEVVDVDVSGIPDGDDAADALHQAVERALHTRHEADPDRDDDRLAVVACTIRIRGRTPARRRIRACLAEVGDEAWVFDVGGRRWVAETLEDTSRPAVDLAAMREERTPRGLVARLVAALGAGTPDPMVDELRAEARRLAAEMGEGRWRLESDSWPIADPDLALETAAWRLLDALLEQRPQGEPS